MKKEKNIFLIRTVLLFLVSVAVLRALNIYHAYIYNDITYSSVFVKAVDVVHDILLIAAYGFSVGAILVCGRVSDTVHAAFSAVLMTAVKACDGVFSIVFDVANGAIKKSDSLKLETAWQFFFWNTAIFAAVYASAAVCVYFFNKKTNDGKTEISVDLPLLSKYTLIPAAVMTVLELVSPVLMCIQFFVSYGKPRPGEAAEMAGDILFVIIEYGFMIYAFELVAVKVLSRIGNNKNKNIKNR